MTGDMDGEAQFTNKLKDKNKKKIGKFKLDPTLNWDFQKIVGINNSEIQFEILNKKKEKER